MKNPITTVLSAVNALAWMLAGRLSLSYGRAAAYRALFPIVALLLFPACLFSQTLTVDYALGNFTSAVSLSVNAAGEMVVLDAGANACIRMRSDGVELSRVQGTGWGSSEFDAPNDVCASFPLAVFVADGKNKRVQQFDKELHFVQTIDDVQTTDGYSFEGAFHPIATAQSTQGELFVLDADGTRVIKFTTRFRAEREFGTYASGDGRLKTPTDICITSDGRVAVADGSAIVYFDQFGNYLSTQTAVGSDAIRTVSSSGLDVIATAPGAISVVNAFSGATVTIPAGMILGDTPVTIRDAACVGEWWFVLTPKQLLVCKRAG